MADQERDDRGRPHALRADREDGARARVVEEVGDGQRLARGDDGPDEPLADTEPAPPLRGHPPADRRAQRHVLAVVLDEPERRGARGEQLGGRVHHALEHLVDRQRRRERLREPRERLQAPTLLAALPEERGAGDGVADVLGNRLQERQLVAVERASLRGDQRHDAPDTVVHGDRHRELGVVAAGGDALPDRGREQA